MEQQYGILDGAWAVLATLLLLLPGAYSYPSNQNDDDFDDAHARSHWSHRNLRAQSHRDLGIASFSDPKSIALKLQNADDFDNLFVSTHQCSKVDTLPPGWCMDEVDQIPSFWGKDIMLDPVGNDISSINSASVEMRHYTYEGYEKCLANKTIVFVGDSRVRYQFMNLAEYLNTKKFMKCHDQGTLNSDDKDCLLIDEKMMGTNPDWNEWYEMTTEGLGHNENGEMTLGEHQDSLCDCYRPAAFHPDHFFENRFVKRRTPFGEINLIFLLNVENKISMSEDFPPYSPFYNDMSKRCNPGQCGRPPFGDNVNAWVGDLNATMWEIFPKLNATHAFVNLGWAHLFDFAAESEFSCTMAEYSEQHNQAGDTKLSYMSHVPKRSDVSHPSDAFDAAKLKCNVDVLDRTTMNEMVPTTWYWDNLHVLSILNEEYNHQLINSICPMVTT